METREQAKSKKDEAHTQDIMEDNKRKIPVIQAKTKLMNAQNKSRATMTQIRKAVEEFATLEDTTDKEVAANCINFQLENTNFGRGRFKSSYRETRQHPE